MRVITLDQARFGQACRDLWSTATADGRPDILLGIRTGGYAVAQAMLDGTNGEDVVLLPITRRRASTAAKNNNPWVGATLRRLPYFVTDRIRVLEHRVLSGRRAMEKASETTGQWEADPAEGAALAEALAKRLHAKILIVDDALDTGATLRAVHALVSSLAPTADVRSAVLVTTTKTPLIKATNSLYTNVLCRFPWSHDAAR